MNAGNAATLTPGTSTVPRILHRGIVRLAALAAAVLVGSVASPLGAFAQEERPQIMPSERRAPQKKDSGPRAVAVLRMAANGKTSLVPIAILINNKFWDASAYKADPVPMALDSGTVYEGEQTGSSLGLFTVSNALHSNAASTQAPWIGTGSWHPNGTEEPKKSQKTDNVPVGMNTEEQPPRLSHNPSATAPASAPSSGSPPSSSTQPASDSKPSGSSGSGDEPPRLSKPASSPSSGAPNAGGAQTPSSSSAPSGSAPSSTPSQSQSKSKDSKAQPENVPASDSGAKEENRPRLRRGKPAESFSDQDVPGYSRPGETAAAPAQPAGSGKVVQTAATEADVKLIPAISDAAGPAPHSYAYDWVKGDEEDRRKQMTDYAKQQVRAYVAALERNRIPANPAPKPAHPTAVHHAAQPEPVLENVQMVAYDLWNSNQPIIVFSAQAHMPSTPTGTAHSEVASELQYSIMLVAYPDIYNNLHRLYVGVTDKMHLDVTPRLELIDAVDADGDGRGELLFRQTSDQGTGWAIYRATGDKLWKMYDSLSPL
jgi:hypothetical protein